MPLFIGTVLGKVDKKRRISVPAGFRAELADQRFPGIIAFPSPRQRSLECCSIEYMEEIANSLYDLGTFSEEQADLASTTIADACRLPFDPEGRVMLTPELMTYAGLIEGGEIAFVGQGERFQIWEPGQRRTYAIEARERLQRNNVSLNIRRRQTPGSGNTGPGGGAPTGGSGGSA